MSRSRNSAVSSQPSTAWHAHAHREHRVVVAVGVEAVADEEHVVERDAGLLGELAHAVGLVDAAAG